jgi:hypothetical protein
MKVHPEMLMKTKEGKKEGVRCLVPGVSKKVPRLGSGVRSLRGHPLDLPILAPASLLPASALQE